MTRILRDTKKTLCKNGFEEKLGELTHETLQKQRKKNILYKTTYRTILKDRYKRNLFVLDKLLIDELLAAVERRTPICLLDTTQC